MKKKKIRFKKPFYILIAVLIILTIGITKLIKHNNYIHSDHYKLLTLGYSEEEIARINNKDNIKIILSREYNKYIIDILNAKYVLNNNIDSYIEYKTKNIDLDIDKVIAYINVRADKDWYSDDLETDVSKGILMLVNKYHYLNEDYKVENLVDMEVKYAASNKKLNAEAYEKFKEMCNAAKRAGYIIYATTAYRSYSSQEAAYTNLKNEGGRIYADKYAARPGFSEHQTGLAVDITYSNKEEDCEFQDSEEYKWLIENAPNYGFILRYPEGKEDITGFNYEPWHFRYVGVDTALIITKDNITFDEYYEYTMGVKE